MAIVFVAKHSRGVGDRDDLGVAEGIAEPDAGGRGKEGTPQLNLHSGSRVDPSRRAGLSAATIPTRAKRMLSQGMIVVWRRQPCADVWSASR